jgi:hypothetical protein
MCDELCGGGCGGGGAQVIHTDPHSELLKDADTPPTNFRSAAAKLSRMLRLGGAPVEEEEGAAVAQGRGRAYEPDETNLLLLGVGEPALPLMCVVGVGCMEVFLLLLRSSSNMVRKRVHERARPHWKSVDEPSLII